MGEVPTYFGGTKLWTWAEMAMASSWVHSKSVCSVRRNV